MVVSQRDHGTDLPAHPFETLNWYQSTRRWQSGTSLPHADTAISHALTPGDIFLGDRVKVGRGFSWNEIRTSQLTSHLAFANMAQRWPPA